MDYPTVYADLPLNMYVPVLRVTKTNIPQSSALFILLRDKLYSAVTTHPASSTNLLDCSYCQGFMALPVCLPCGHSLCKTCLDNACATHAVCPRCKQTISPSSVARSPTLVLRNASESFYPKWVQSSQYRETGNKFANEGHFPQAIEWYNKAVELVRDHRVYGNRSRSYLAVNELEKALADAETACTIRPLWKKGHFRRACALEKQGKWIDATAAYLLCYYLSDSKDQPIMASKICQLLEEFRVDMTPYENHLSLEAHPLSVLKLSKGRFSETSLIPTIDHIVELAVRWLKKVSDGGTKLDIASISANTFECGLCKELMNKPLTLSCGHSFCCSCIVRSFDHSKTCPICRVVLYEFFEVYAHNSGVFKIDECLHRVIQEHFPTRIEAQKEAESSHNVRVGTCESELLPIFVCMQALPRIFCPLHVFEPQYRLLIRRCMESGCRRFGMCQQLSSDGTFSEYGTVLYINSVEYTPDGRSLVKTVGERRFRVIRHEVIDGYPQAWVKFLFDQRVTEKSDIDSLRALQSEVYTHAKLWLESLPSPVTNVMVKSACSPLPPIEKIPEVCPNGPMWLWWYIHSLPLSPQLKKEMFTSTSLRERLLKLKQILPSRSP